MNQQHYLSIAHEDRFTKTNLEKNQIAYDSHIGALSALDFSNILDVLEWCKQCAILRDYVGVHNIRAENIQAKFAEHNITPDDAPIQDENSVAALLQLCRQALIALTYRGLLQPHCVTAPIEFYQKKFARKV